MALTLRSTAVGEALDKYVSETLNLGAFGKRFVECRPVNLRNAYILLSDDDIENFRYKEGRSYAQGDIFKAMAKILYVESLLHQKAIIVEYALEQITDPVVTGLPISPISYENSFLYALERDSLSYSSIESALNLCFSAMGLTAFLLPEGLIEISENKEIINSGALCKAIETIVVGIYDNETFLMAYPR